LESLNITRKHVIIVKGELNEANLGVGDLGDRAQRDEEGHSLAEEAVLHLGEGSEHLGGALGVSDIGDLLVVSLRVYVVKEGGLIKSAHLIPGKVPEFSLINIRVKGLVLAAERVTSVVSEPYIVTGAGSHESWRNIGIVVDPGIG
jgi:hypothetical protein